VNERHTAAQVRTFFDNAASDFDAIYSGRTSPIMRMLNNWLRRDIYQRYEMTIAECDGVDGRRVLDIGCGSGRYCHELASRGAAECCGIDFAPAMLDLASAIGLQRGIAGRCRFLLGGYLEHKFEQPFDISIAIGYFDYIADPLTHLKKMRADTRGKLISVFPRAGTLRAAVRKVRLGLKRCPVFFYRPEQIDDLLAHSGWRRVKLERVGQLWFVVAAPA
jgi:SAM-dependent methyltransferase